MAEAAGGSARPARGPEDRDRPAGAARPRGTRRRFILTAGAAALAGVAGCSAAPGAGSRTASPGAGTGPRTTTGAGGRPTTRAGRRAGGSSKPVSILAAGSLQDALQRGLEPAVDVPVQVEAHGSRTVARLVAEGQRDPDIVTVADVALFQDPLSPPWYSTFTSNAVVVAYNPATQGGRKVGDAGAARWFEPMVAGDVRLGRTDPRQDPLGYRTLFTLELASRYYADASDLRTRILRRDQIYPETALISQFETGAIDAAFAYRNMAVERGYAFVDLPNQIDLSDPRYAADWYETVSYAQPDGRTVRGGLIGYGSTIRHPSDAALTVFAAQTTGAYLGRFGFVRPAGFPRYHGSVPTRVRAATRAAGATTSNATATPASSTAGLVPPPSTTDAGRRGPG